MTADELTQRLAANPQMCPLWVAARPLYEDGGVLYLSQISDGDERIGMAHIWIWDKTAMGKPRFARKAALELMKSERLDRLVCEIDARNRLAIRFAQSMGAHEIGPVRQRKDYRGKYFDVILLDALPGDLNGNAH